MSYFPNVDKIKYEGVETKNMYAFRHYNPDELVLGKPMKEHLRFSLAFWHTITEDGSDPFGVGTYQRNWDEKDPIETAKNRVDAFFELLTKLNMEYFCFHDVDIAPQGESLEEFFNNLDIITDYIKEKMEEHNVNLLWNTQNMFSHPRFLNGASTSNNADVYAYSAAQIKKTIDISKKLGGKNVVFWGGREGYETLLNTDMSLELDNMAKMFKMAVDYANSINHDIQFLIEPKPKEPMTHQYDYDAATAMAFLQKYDLTDDFKLNLEGNHATLAGHTFEHELRVARTYNALGSIDANHAEKMLGWDTDEFPTNIYDTTLTMYEILENGGIEPGGINFDAKVRRTSFEMNDLVLAHIAGMDTFARGLKAAAKIKDDKFISNVLDEKYKSFTHGIGQNIVDGKETLESLSEYALNLKEIKLESSHIEHIKSVFNDYLT
ncbi:xylose isomerase [Ruoffia tabacinasalis]|uniref:Xylose isomerase n=1 Tax=Ruoffia tabacinasalis TaxID=87458 RepID=A0A5R9DU56_9LACT|nr:xylose isomerase [Ruoffia tabacinasalis]TLQ39864.1 xylose isomerase [Ruoffia tabacinasalis]